VLAGGLVAAAGCSHASPRPTRRRPPADADALARARSDEADLISACEAEGLTAEREVHVAHLLAVGGSHPATTAALTLDEPITTLLTNSAETLRSLAMGATDGGNAARLASIAASHAAATA
jgi:hypothetical protein